MCARVWARTWAGLCTRVLRSRVSVGTARDGLQGRFVKVTNCNLLQLKALLHTASELRD